MTEIEECPSCAGRPEDRGADYLRSVVEQIHRDTHDALSAVPVQPPPRDPAGEGEERCQECGHLLNGSAECHYTNEDGTDRWCSVGGCPCDTTRPSSTTGETAGQGVEEAWERIEETRDGHGVEVALWRQSRPTWTDIRAVPLAVEDEIAHQFALEQYGLLKARAERAEARATAAEAERDRLREALERMTLAVTNAKLEFDAIYRVCHADSLLVGEDVADSALMKAARASRMMARALAGESTGATDKEQG